MRPFLISLFALLTHTLHAQQVNLSDSLRNVFCSEPAFTARFDTRNSFVSGSSARIMGIKAGFSWKKTISIGLGYNWLASKHFSDIEIDSLPVTSRLKFRYISPYIEYVFYRNGPWEASVPVQLGMGSSFLKSENDGSDKIHSRGGVLLYEPAMTIEYKVLNLLGFSVGAGYRLMLVNNREIAERFTAPVYMLRVRVIFDEVKKRIEEGVTDE